MKIKWIVSSAAFMKIPLAGRPWSGTPFSTSLRRGMTKRVPSSHGFLPDTSREKYRGIYSKSIILEVWHLKEDTCI